jgi:hypothetical protein
MSASLAARGDPTEELEFAVDLINRVVAGQTGTLYGVHVNSAEVASAKLRAMTSVARRLRAGLP